MLHSKFGRESLPQKKKSSIKLYFFLTFTILFAAGLVWIFNNRQRILFRLKKNNYAAIIHNVESYEKALIENTDDKNLHLNESDELLKKLINDNPTDSYLYFLLGRLFTAECTIPLIKDPEKLSDIFFRDYIKRYQTPASISISHWEQGITNTRKALLLGLPENETQQAVANLVSLYLAGGSAYWNSGMEYLTPQNMKTSPLIDNIYKVLLLQNAPDWDLFTKQYGQETSTFWMALYYLKIRNYPLGFYNLKNLLLSDSVYLRNNAYYIMGHIMGEQKEMPLKLYYHSMIDYEEFLKRNPWFLEEHNYTLRYLGQEAAARKFLSQYEKMVLELKESI